MVATQTIKLKPALLVRQAITVLSTQTTQLGALKVSLLRELELTVAFPAHLTSL